MYEMAAGYLADMVAGREANVESFDVTDVALHLRRLRLTS